MFGHTYNKKLFTGYQKSKFNWALYTLPGNPIAESIDFFFLVVESFLMAYLSTGQKIKAYKDIEMSMYTGNFQGP